VTKKSQMKYLENKTFEKKVSYKNCTKHFLTSFTAATFLVDILFRLLLKTKSANNRCVIF